jgi:hypothetical protein
MEDLSAHAFKRVVERGITPEEIVEVLTKPLLAYPTGSDRMWLTRKVNGRLVRVLVGNDGRLVTVWASGCSSEDHRPDERALEVEL